MWSIFNSRHIIAPSQNKCIIILDFKPDYATDVSVWLSKHIVTDAETPINPVANLLSQYYAVYRLKKTSKLLISK